MKVYKGRLVRHQWHHEFGTGIVLASRTKEKFDRDGGGLFAHQLKVVWPIGGKGWFDRDVLVMLTTEPAPAPSEQPLSEP